MLRTCTRIARALRPIPQHSRWMSATVSSSSEEGGGTPPPPPKQEIREENKNPDKATGIQGQSELQQLSQSQSAKISRELIEGEQDTLYKNLELEVLAYEPSVLDSYQWFVIASASHLGIPIGKCWAPNKSDKFRFPLLKSAFVHKKHQVHYEVRTYHRFMTFHHLTGSTANTFLEYIERNLPEGCGLKVTRVMVQPLPTFISHKQQSNKGEEEEAGSKKTQPEQ